MTIRKSPVPKKKNSIRFPPSDFKHYFTLFSNFFSFFPHGTCSLSVSCLYLALDEVYHLIRAALPSNSTRLKRVFYKNEDMIYKRDYHPLWCSVPGNLKSYYILLAPLQTTFPRIKHPWIKNLELFPLRSPLLKES